jgi:hypothetical protein
MAAQLRGLAESIASEPGLLWKIWTENAAAGEAGGVYLFESRAAAEAYVEKHSRRMADAGVPAGALRAKVFEVNTELSALDRAPLPK